MLMVVLKLNIFSSMVAWKMSNRLWINNVTLWKTMIIKIGKRCLKTEMHRLVAMHLRIG